MPEEKDPLRAYHARMRSVHQILHKVPLHANCSEEEASQTSWVSLLLQPTEFASIKRSAASNTSHTSRKGF